MAEQHREESSVLVVNPIMEGRDGDNSQSVDVVEKQQPPTAEDNKPTITPNEDPMLGFLTLLAKVERPSCANCESKDLSPMFFCNTCGRVLPRTNLIQLIFHYLSNVMNDKCV